MGPNTNFIVAVTGRTTKEQVVRHLLDISSVLFGKPATFVKINPQANVVFSIPWSKVDGKQSETYKELEEDDLGFIYLGTDAPEGVKSSVSFDSSNSIFMTATLSIDGVSMARVYEEQLFEMAFQFINRLNTESCPSIVMCGEEFECSNNFTDWNDCDSKLFEDDLLKWIIMNKDTATNFRVLKQSGRFSMKMKNDFVIFEVRN